MKENLFTAFYGQCRRILERSIETVDSKEMREKIRAFSDHYLSLIEAIPIRALITDLHERKSEGKLIGATAQKQYEYYNSELLNDEQYLDSFFEKFPEIKRLLEVQAEYFVSLLVDIFGRLDSDKQQIAELLCGGKDFHRVKDMDISVADPHNGGKRVVKLRLDNDTVLYYKPHGLKKCRMYQEAYGCLCEKAGLRSCQVRCIDRGNYGWEEEITYQGCETEEEIQRFYYRMGIHLFLGYALSASDLHGENIIAHGEFPFIVDFETFPGYGAGFSGNNAEESVRGVIADSVLRTGMLPVLAWGQGGDSVVVSALHSGEKITTPFKMPIIKNKGTSDICIDYEPLEIELPDCTPTLQGKQVNAADYTEMLCDGFGFAYRTFLQDSNIRQMLAGFFNGRARVVLRHTQQYAMHRFTSLHPEFTCETEGRRRLLSALYPYGGDSKDGIPGLVHQDGQARQLGYEAEALLQLDIPYFELDGKKQSLYDGNGREYCGYFPVEPVRAWKSKMDKLGDADLERQLILIRLSMALLRSHVPENSSNKIAGLQERTLGQNLEDRIRSIVAWLCRNAVISGEDISWIGLQFFSNEKWKAAPIGMYIYDGIAGLAILFAVYLQQFSDEEAEQINFLLEKKLFRYTDYLADEKKDSEHRKTGALDGEGSIIYTYLQLHRITGKKEFLLYAEKHFKIVLGFADNDEVYDYLGGNAGLIFAAMMLYGETKNEAYREAAVCMEERLWNKAVRMKQGCGWINAGTEVPLAGMAHGNAGFLMAYADLYTQEEPKYLQKIYQLLEYEDSLYSDEEKNWLDLRNTEQKRIMNAWCHGAPGILVSRMKLEERVRIDMVERDIERAAEALFSQPCGRHICLCHGIAGNLLIMRFYLQKYDKKRYCNQYELLLQEFINKMETYGQAVPYEYFNPALMNGISGVALALILIYKGCTV